MVKFHTDYDFKRDSLYIYKETEGAVKSFEFGDEAVIDFDSPTSVSGIEIFNISKEFELPKYYFKSIKKASIRTRWSGNVLLIYWVVLFDTEKIETVREEKVSARLLIPARAV